MSVRHAQRFICGRRTLVPGSLVHTVLELAHANGNSHAYTREDMFATLVCTIEHTGPVHYGAVLNLYGPEAGTLWALWRDRGEPNAVIELPDCPAGREVDSPCSEFAGHPGGHAFELADPPQIAAPFPLQHDPLP